MEILKIQDGMKMNAAGKTTKKSHIWISDVFLEHRPPPLRSIHYPSHTLPVEFLQKDFQGKLSAASANFIILEMMLASQCFANERKQEKEKVSDALLTWCIIVNFVLFPVFWVGQSVSWEVLWVLQNVKSCVAIYNCPGLWKQMIYHRAQRLM